MARMHQWIGLSFISLALTGCVAQEKYNARKLAHEQTIERLAYAEAKEQAAAAENALLKEQLSTIGQNEETRQAMLANMQNQNNELQRQNDELNRRYGDAMSKVGTGAILPQPLNDALTTFAAQHPDLVEFDSNRGIVKFKSDVTFATGSADLTSNAKQAIDRFAEILNSQAAVGYEVMVAGHTDNQPVVNPATIQRGHKDNWHLSSHRAISVGSELQRQRVSPQRIAVTGYADQRPVASNNTDAGRQQNRRVEVLILPTTVGGPVAAGPASGEPTRTNPNKDTTVGADDRPVFNK